MRRNALPLLFSVPVALFAFACDAPSVESERHQGSSSSIINGNASTSTDDDAVALLWMGNSFCTGTLIAPNLLLTARHCVSEPGAGQSECEPFGADKSPSTMTVSLGEHPSSQAPVAAGAKLFVENRSTVCGQDIALILLDKDVPGVKPKQVRLTPPKVGELVTAIGYGQDENEAITGRRMRSGIAIEAVGPASRTATANGQTVGVNVPANDFMTGESVCHGDSGGPLFDAQGQVIGTTSRGTALGCVGTPAIFSSTGAHAVLIKTALAAAGHPLSTTTDAGTDAAPPPAPVADAGADATTTDAGPAIPTSAGDEPGKEAPTSTDDGTAKKGSKTTDEDDDDDTDSKTSKGSSKPKADVASPRTLSAGCSAVPAGIGDTAMTPFVIALALMALRRRRRCAHASSSS